MDFATWTRALSGRGLQVVPPSHSVPVVVWALRQQGGLPGGLLHFRCQGRTATLVEYAESAIVLAEPASMCGCGCGLTARLPETTPRLTLRPDAEPSRAVRFDGAAREGWVGYEAGLLRVPRAAALFDELLAELEALPVRAAGRSRSAVPGR
jgi:hypothetical protein